MKKICFILTLCCVISLLAGCSLPVQNSLEDNTQSTTQASEKINMDSEEKAGSISTDEMSSIAGTSKSQGDVAENTKKSTMVNLFYQDKEGILIPVTRRVQKQEALARLAIQGLVDSAASREELEYYGLYPVLPQGTEILGISLRDGNAAIEFNDQLLNYSTALAERNIVSSIVYTLTEFETIKRVKILIKGQTLQQLNFKTDISDYLSRENVLINASRVNLKANAAKLDAYIFKYLNDKFSYILPRSIEFENADKEALFKKLISKLQKEKPYPGFYSQFPAKTTLLQCKAEGTTLSLDFSKDIRNYGGSAREQGLVQQILYTAEQWEGIEQVKVTIEGRGDYLAEGTELVRPFKIPKEINDYIDPVK